MRISDWSSDVCSSDLSLRSTRRLAPVGSTAMPRLRRLSMVDSSRFRPVASMKGTRSSRSTTCRGGFRVHDSARSSESTEPKKNGPSIRSEEHTSELQSLMRISYAVFCLKKKKHHKD